MIGSGVGLGSKVDPSEPILELLVPPMGKSCFLSARLVWGGAGALCTRPPEWRLPEKEAGTEKMERAITRASMNWPEHFTNINSL